VDRSCEASDFMDGENFLTNWPTINFLRWALLHGIIEVFWLFCIVIKRVVVPTREWLTYSKSLHEDLSVWLAWPQEYNVSAVSLNWLDEEGRGRRVLFELLVEELHHLHDINLWTFSEIYRAGLRKITTNLNQDSRASRDLNRAASVYKSEAFLFETNCWMGNFHVNTVINLRVP
jgi:hypothetical protein